MAGIVSRGVYLRSVAIDAIDTRSWAMSMKVARYLLRYIQ